MINGSRPNSLLLATFEALLLISLWDTGSPVHWLDGFAMVMSPSNGETAVHGSHCPGDIVVRIHKVLALPRSWNVYLSLEIGIEIDFGSS